MRLWLWQSGLYFYSQYGCFFDSEVLFIAVEPYFVFFVASCVHAATDFTRSRWLREEHFPFDTHSTYGSWDEWRVAVAPDGAILINIK